MQEGQVRRRVDRDAAGCHDAAQQRQRLVDQVAEVDRARSQLERAGLHAGHVEEVGNEPPQPVRLQLNELQQLSPVVGAQAGVDLAHARHGRLDGGQWSPQVVRGGTHQGPTPTVDLLEQARPQGLLAQLGPVDGERRLVGKRAEQAPLTLHQLHVLEHQHADGPVAHHQCHRHPPRSGLLEQPEGPRLAAPRRHRSDVRLGQGLACARRDLQLRTRCPECRRRASGRTRRRPTRDEDGLHRGHDVRQQLRQREIADERLRQLVQPFRFCGPALRLLAGTPQLGHDLGDDQHDHGVDGERDPVLGRADREGVVGGEEEEVVDDEAPECPDDTGKEAADDDSHQCGQHEHQGGDGDAQVGPEGKQHGQERAESGQGDDDPPRRSLVRSPGSQPAWSDVPHRFRSSECLLSVPTPWRGPAMRGGDDREHG